MEGNHGCGGPRYLFSFCARNGQVWGFIVGLIAIIKLRNGGTLLNMHCKINC